MQSSITADGRELLRLDDEALRQVIITPRSARAPFGSRVGDADWWYPEDWYDHLRPSEVRVPHESHFPLLRHPQLEMSIKRYLLAVTYFPQRSIPDLSSLKQRAYLLNRVACWLSRHGYRMFRDMPVTRLPELWQDLGANWRSGSSRTILERFFGEMSEYVARGHIVDCFKIGGPEMEGNRGSSPSVREDPSATLDAPAAPTKDQAAEDGVWQPLPDEWVEQAGYRWTYILRDVLPNLRRMMADWHVLNPKDSTERVRAWGKSGLNSALTAARLKEIKRLTRNDYLRSFSWEDSEGNRLERLTFAIGGETSMPTSWREVLRLLAVIQSSLYSLLLLLTAGRRSEISTLKRGRLLIEVIEEDSGYSHLHGRSYKLSGFGIGDETAWPIPASIAPYFEDWLAVCEVVAPSVTSLWFSTAPESLGQKRPCFNHMMKQSCVWLALRALQGDSNAHAHRFRKTMARLAVLCLQGAPLILQQILGHDGLLTTLKYIFSDPSIRDELRDVLEEVRLELAIKVAEELDRAGGVGAIRLREARDLFQSEHLKVPSTEKAQRFHARDFAVAQLADGGFDLKVLFAGIICIKPPGASGSCSLSGGEPNVSRCEVDCIHYLALPENKVHVRITLEWLLAELGDLKVLGNALLVTFYRAQFVDQSRIFNDLRIEYLADIRVISALPPECLKRMRTPLRG